MSKKSCPLLYRKLLCKIGQDFVDIQYSVFRNLTATKLTLVKGIHRSPTKGKIYVYKNFVSLTVYCVSKKSCPRCIEQVDGCLDDETSDEGTSDEETSDEETSEEETSEEETSKDKSPAASSSPAKEQQQPSLEEILYVFQETAEKKLDKKFQEFLEDIRNSQV